MKKKKRSESKDVKGKENEIKDYKKGHRRRDKTKEKENEKNNIIKKRNRRQN